METLTLALACLHGVSLRVVLKLTLEPGGGAGTSERGATIKEDETFPTRRGFDSCLDFFVAFMSTHSRTVQ